MGEAVGQLYVERYFPPEAKAKADALVQNLIRAIAENPDANIASLSMGTLAETAQLTVSFNASLEESY